MKMQMPLAPLLVMEEVDKEEKFYGREGICVFAHVSEDRLPTGRDQRMVVGWEETLSSLRMSRVSAPQTKGC